MSVNSGTYASEKQYFQEVVEELGKKDIKVVLIKNDKNWPEVSLAIEVLGDIGNKNTGNDMKKYRICSLKLSDKE